MITTLLNSEDLFGVSVILFSAFVKVNVFTAVPSFLNSTVLSIILS
jgi:hypothetical protein